jgi:hypothetical protein
MQPNGGNNWISNSPAPWGYNRDTAIGGLAPNNTWSNLNNGSSAPSHGIFASPTGTFAPDNGSFYTTHNGQIPTTESNFSPTHHSGVAPTPSGFVQTNTHNDIASTGQLSFNGLNQIRNAPLMPAPGSPGANRPQAMSNNGNNGYEMDAYEQWLRNNPEGTPDLDDPYLKALIKQFSDKSRATRLQKMESARDGQVSSTHNDASWLR